MVVLTIYQVNLLKLQNLGSVKQKTSILISNFFNFVCLLKQPKLPLWTECTKSIQEFDISKTASNFFNLRINTLDAE